MYAARSKAHLADDAYPRKTSDVLREILYGAGSRFAVGTSVVLAKAMRIGFAYSEAGDFRTEAVPGIQELNTKVKQHVTVSHNFFVRKGDFLDGPPVDFRLRPKEAGPPCPAEGGGGWVSGQDGGAGMGAKVPEQAHGDPGVQVRDKVN